MVTHLQTVTVNFESSSPYRVIESEQGFCGWRTAKIQWIQGGWEGAVRVWVVLEHHAGWVQEPLLVGQLVRPHDVEVGRAECLQSFTRVYHLAEQGGVKLKQILVWLSRGCYFPKPSSHHKLNVHWAADVLQSGHGALAFHHAAEEELLWIGQAAVKTGVTTVDQSVWFTRDQGQEGEKKL